MVNPLKTQFQFTPSMLFLYLIVLIGAVQIISLIISSIFTTVPAFKSGPLLIVISGILAVIFLAKIVFKGNFERTDFIGFLLIIGVVILLHIFGAQFLPQIFSLIDSSAMESALELGSTLRIN